MGKIKIAAFAAVQLMAFSLYAQSITVGANNAGKVEYNVSKPSKGTLVFTLFGDGDYTISDNPVHEFDSGSYPTESFFMEGYDLNPPKYSAVTTTPTAGGSSANNSRRSMTNEIEIVATWRPSFGTDDFFIVTFQNMNGGGPVNGCIEFHYNTNDLSLYQPDVKTYGKVINQSHEPSSETLYDYKLKWEFSNLDVGEIRNIYIPAAVLVPLGQSLPLKAKYMVNCDDSQGGGDGGSGGSGGGGGATANVSMTSAAYPWDPNGKLVYPECLEPFKDFQQMEFTIDFFNEGENFATDVVILDTLPMTLEPGSFILSDYEFAPLVTISGQEIKFEFNGINLPGVNQNDGNVYTEDDVSSFVSFKVCTRPPLTGCISNVATIYFDALAGIPTTVAKACTEEECINNNSCDATDSDGTAPTWKMTKQERDDISISPNPFENRINIALDLNDQGMQNIQFEVYDSAGRTMKKMNFQVEGTGKVEKEIYLNDLPGGLYFLVVNANEKEYTKKIVKY